MSERIERLWTFGAPPVNCNIPETWTPEVKALFERVTAGDWRALPDLLAVDEDFEMIPAVRATYWIVKHDPVISEEERRDVLDRLAHIRGRASKYGRSKLSPKYELAYTLNWLTALIEHRGLMDLRDNPRGLSEALRTLGGMLNEAFLDEITRGLRESAQSVRSPRSWALHALAGIYDSDPKTIEQRIQRPAEPGAERNVPPGGFPSVEDFKREMILRDLREKRERTGQVSEAERVAERRGVSVETVIEEVRNRPLTRIEGLPPETPEQREEAIRAMLKPYPTPRVTVSMLPE